jgi:choline dehydrogenase-like flavoprotein
MHRCGELDRRSLVALHRCLADEIADAGWGRLQPDLTEQLMPWPIHSDASHHMGATRMGADPSTSVVDADLQVHTVAGVYVVGGSVFPTSGCVNPTYTIVALALKLGDHLRQRLGSSDPAAAAF